MAWFRYAEYIKYGLGSILSSLSQVNLSSVPELDWFTDEYDIYADGTTSYNPEDDAVALFTGVVRYVGYNGASDSNDGLTEQTSWLTMQHAVENVSAGDKVMINGGDYWNGYWYESFGLDEGAVWIGDGDVNFWGCAEDDSSLFSLDALLTNTYVATFTQFESVWDMSINNPYWADQYPSMPNLGWMTEVASSALVDVTPNSWYYDSATDLLYIRTHDDREPDSDIKCMTDSTCRMSSNDADEYWENLNFVGLEFAPNSFFTGGTVVLNKIRCGYTQGEAFVARGNADSARFIRQDCIVMSGYDDMFTGKGTCNIIDINCTGADTPTSGSNNSSTGHDYCNFTRIGGNYFDANNKVIGNIQAGIAVHVAVNSYKTYDVGFTANDSDYGTGTSVTNNIYINCTQLQPNGDPSMSTYSIYGTGAITLQGTVFTGLLFSGAVITESTEFISI